MNQMSCYLNIIPCRLTWFNAYRPLRPLLNSIVCAEFEKRYLGMTVILADLVSQQSTRRKVLMCTAEPMWSFCTAVVWPQFVNALSTISPQIGLCVTHPI